LPITITYKTTNYPIETIIDVIVTTIDLGRSLVGAVNRMFYKDHPKPENHAICISGYRVNEARNLDVQIVDSNIGIYPLLVEILYKYMCRERLFIGRLKNREHMRQ